MEIQQLRDYFYRHFLGRIGVHRVQTDIEPPCTHTNSREVETYPIRTEIRAAGSSLFNLNRIVSSGKGFRFLKDVAKVKGSRITRYVPEELKVRTVSGPQVHVRGGMKNILVLPQERSNRLQWQAERPKREGELLLAWFGPIVENAVVKLTLNKKRGTLLIWYNPQSRHFNVKGLYLYRRLGIGENLEWRWV